MSLDDRYQSKAEVYYHRIRRNFRKIRPAKFEKFIVPKNVSSVIEDDTIVLSCLDNQSTRKLLAEHVRSLQNCVMISGASDMLKVNVHIHIIKNGKELTRGMDEVHANIANPPPGDKNPGQMNCEERARQEGGGQTITGNMVAATLMHNYFTKISKGGLKDKKVMEELVRNSEVFLHLDRYALSSISRAK